MDDNKEKDEVQEMFSKQLEAKELEEIEEEENEKNTKVSGETHYTDIISPIIGLILGIASLFDQLWFTAYFGLIFCGLGIYMCKKKKESLNRGILLLNVIALAVCFFMGGMWIILLIMNKM